MDYMLEQETGRVKTSKLIDWKGTVGMGDAMWGLNVAHRWAHDNGHALTTLRFHWNHGPDYRHHPDDPETIIERIDYVHTLYHNKDLVKTEHVFNSTDAAIFRERYRGVDIKPVPYNPVNYWQFNPSTFEDPIEGKVVVWRPFFNAEKPHDWKLEVNEERWELVLSSLEQQGYTITELSYRTDIRSAVKHIKQAEFVVCYDGMWHYVARNLHKPMLVFSRNAISLFHTPNALLLSRDDCVDWINKLTKPWNGTTRLQMMREAAQSHRIKTGEMYIEGLFKNIEWADPV